MTAPKKEKKQVRIYLDPEEARMLTDAMQSFEGWTETDVMTLVAHAGLRALSDSAYRFQWPLKLTSNPGNSPARYTLNEPSLAKKK